MPFDAGLRQFPTEFLIYKTILMKRKTLFSLIAFLGGFGLSFACTGISFRAADSSWVVARTIEWGESELNSEYVIVPRGTRFVSYTPTGLNGAEFVSQYGIVGVSVVQKEFIAEGLNEAGLSAGLFYFPAYGKYPEFDAQKPKKYLADLQVVAWMLSQFATVDEVKAAIASVRITGLQGSATVHWRIADEEGNQVVLEIIDGKPVFYENTVGVLTNAPGFEWQVTNLNNYVNLYPGSAGIKTYGKAVVHPFGAGTGFLGLPGDVTPPSRFVRAFFYKQTAPRQPDGPATVVQCFHILNNFDIPIGTEFEEGKVPDLPSATQWTSATDITNRKFYYRSMYNSQIRCIDLTKIDFAKTPYVAKPLDARKAEPIVPVEG